MDDIGNRIKHIIHELKEYVETKLELTLLNISDQITYLLGKSLQNLIGYTILAIGLVFGMTALAIYLGEVLDERWAGYAIVSSPFIIIGLIFVLFKPKKITRKIQDQILAELLNSFNEDEDEDKDKVKELPSKETSNKSKD